MDDLGNNWSFTLCVNFVACDFNAFFFLQEVENISNRDDIYNF